MVNLLRFYRLPNVCLGLLMLIGSVIFTGCGPQSTQKSAFKGHDISGSGLGQNLAMQDRNGQLRTLADYQGKIVVVFFGFTQCPDICPTALSQLAQAVDSLEETTQKNVQVLMISVDPARDTPTVLHDYVQLFHPEFEGLTGTAEQLHKTAQSFKAFYAKVPSLQTDQYSMDHSASFYVLDQQGKARSLLDGDASPSDIAHDIRLLLEKKS